MHKTAYAKKAPRGAFLMSPNQGNARTYETPFTE